MPYSKTILCLANSRKPPSGRCVAGREVVGGGFGDWIRPVSARATREISEEERRYENGTHPKVLDVIEIQMSEAMPHDNQQENHQIDDQFYWVKRRTIGWQELLDAVEQVNGPLWTNNSSSYYGRQDRVPVAELGSLDRSLYLIRPDNFRICVIVEGAQFNNPRRRVRARFRLSGHDYHVFVTDPVVEEQYLAMQDGEYPIADAVICMSLGELHSDGYGYKLAAAVITPQRAH